MITIVAISSEQDWNKRKGFIESIRKLYDFPIVLCKTVERGVSCKLSEEDDVTYVQYGYEDWSFSDARNYALEFVETEWACSLDMDEILILDSYDLHEIQNATPQIGGFMLGVVSYMPKENQVNEYGDNTKIFRSKYRYRFNCHESVKPDIIEDGKNVATNGGLIKHQGYRNWKKDLGHKAERNIKLLCKDVLEYGLNDRITNYLFKTTKDLIEWQSSQQQK